MNNRPLVSVVTPTWNRHETLLNVCIPSVQKQTYPNIEHIIVCDGMDLSLMKDLLGISLQGPHHDLRSVALGRNWHHFTGGTSVGAIPRRVGTYLSQGSYIAYLDDDDEYLPDHIESLVELIERENVDFVFSQMKRDWSDDRGDDVIGDGNILYGRVGTPMLLHKAECLQKVNWQTEGYGEDFTFYVDLVNAGYRWAFLPQITSLYHKKV